MAKERITPCKFYICEGECTEGRESEHSGFCQKCRKYKPRAFEKHVNRKKEELEKVRKKEFKELEWLELEYKLVENMGYKRAIYKEGDKKVKIVDVA